MRNLARYRKFVTALVAGAAVLAVSIPLNADPRLIAAGQLVTALAVLAGPANAPATRSQPPTRLARPEDRRQAGWP